MIWLTGMSGAGKSTLALALKQEFTRRGRAAAVLDGDEVRHGLSADLGFSHEARTENVRRVAEVARLMSDAGLIVIVALVSPYRADRRRAREIVSKGGGPFLEVFVDAPLAVCEGRDVKGLYKRARAGQLANFTGVSDPYEPPAEPDFAVNTDRDELADCLGQLLRELRERWRLVE